jgi:alkylated DNA nucleotide flippase Atl1
MSLTQNEQAVWSALETAHSTAVPLSFGDLARMAGLSMNATKMALYKLQQHGLIMGMPD